MSAAWRDEQHRLRVEVAERALLLFQAMRQPWWRVGTARWDRLSPSTGVPSGHSRGLKAVRLGPFGRCPNDNEVPARSPSCYSGRSRHQPDGAKPHRIAASTSARPRRTPHPRSQRGRTGGVERSPSGRSPCCFHAGGGVPLAGPRHRSIPDLIGALAEPLGSSRPVKPAGSRRAERSAGADRPRAGALSPARAA
jgi:hypothetical protein